MTWSTDVDLSGRMLVVVAVSMALLAASAQPVAAADEFAVGSQHATEAEFQTATSLENMIIANGSMELATNPPTYTTLSRWPANAGSGATVTDTISGHDMSLQGGSWTSSPSLTGDAALNFSRTEYAYQDGFHTAFNGRSDAGTVTIPFVAWNTTSNGAQLIAQAAGDTSATNVDSGQRWSISLTENKTILLSSYQGSTLESSATFSHGTKHVVTATWNSSGRFLFVDGSLVAHDDVTQLNDGGPAYDLFLGTGPYSIREGIPGDAVAIDDVRIGTSDLSRGEIKRLHTLLLSSAAPTGTYRSSNHTVTSPHGAWTNLSLENATASVEWQTWTGTQWQVVNSSTYSNTGNHTLDISGTSYEQWRVNVSFEKTGENPTAQLHDEGILVETSAPTVDNANATPDTANRTVESPVELTVAVDDPDFDNGDTLTVDYYVDDSQVGSKQVSTAGNVTFTPTVAAGSHSWHVEVRDQFGHSTSSATFRFTTSSEVKILDEQNPNQLVKDDVEVTVLLYSNTTVAKRTVSDGTVNMSGLPLNSTIIATTQADGWIDRRILIQNLTRQQEIYLLNSSSNALPVTFDLQDKSGNFPEDSSQLYVQKALNTSNTDGLEWQTVSGDYFGADGSFPTQLLYQQRYRLVIRNSQGDRRVLGNFIPTQSGTFPVEIGKIVWDPPKGESVTADSTLRAVNESDPTFENATKKFVVEYFDSEAATTKLTINVSVRGNGSIYSTTVFGVRSHKESIPLTVAQADENLVVNVTAERTDEDFTHEWQFGKPDDVELDADPMWVNIGVQVTMLAVVGLVAGSMPKKGGLVVTSAAFGVSWLGWWEIHPASLGIMGVIALFAAARGRGGAT